MKFQISGISYYRISYWVTPNRNNLFTFFKEVAMLSKRFIKTIVAPLSATTKFSLWSSADCNPLSIFITGTWIPHYFLGSGGTIKDLPRSSKENNRSRINCVMIKSALTLFILGGKWQNPFKFKKWCFERRKYVMGKEGWWRISLTKTHVSVSLERQSNKTKGTEFY